MAKISLQNLDNLQNEATTLAAFNNNNALIREAIDNTLSRDGTSPNQMDTPLDMNSKKIINLPDAFTDQEPVTYGQFTNAVNILGAGAAVTGSYVTTSSVSGLLQERVLTAGSNISITDNGPGSIVTVGVSSSPSFTGTVSTSGVFSTTAKGSLLGIAGGTSATGALATTDANLLLYNFGATNWAGIGTDNGGQLWFRTGLSGTPAAALYIDTNQSTHIMGVLNISSGLIVNVGTFVEFLRPDNSNQFKISYSLNDLILRWSFNDAITIMSLSNTGDLNAIGSVPTFGPGGTGTTALSMTLNGSSGAAGGARQFWAKNSVTKWQMGFSNTINGSGTSDDFLIYNQAVGPAMTIATADSSVAIGSTTVSTSTTTGALKVAGGLGVVGTVSAATYQLGNGGAIVSTPTYLQFVEPAGANTFSSGGGVDPTNYYSNTTHQFFNRTSTILFVSINASAFLASTSIVSSSATGGIGYTTGAGGTVTQATSKTTGVTLNKVSGSITMNAAALAAGTIVSFVLTDSAIASTDVLILNHISGGTPGSYSLNARAASGSATIDVRNNTAGSLSEAIVIQFALIKGVNA